MASTEGNLLTAAYRRQQLAVRASALQDVTRAWQLWTPGRVDSFGRFTDLAVPLLAARYGQAAALATGYYRRFRAAEGVRGGDTPQLPGPLRPDDVIPSLRATGLAGTMRALRAGFSPQAASRAGLTQALGTAGRVTLNGGRAAIVASVGADPAAQGWQRIASGGACDFCRMLASRGPAYKSDRTADFQAHDHCACSAEPVFERAPAPAPGGGLAGGGGRGPGASAAGAGGAGGGRPPAPPAGGAEPADDFGPEDTSPATAEQRRVVGELLTARARGGQDFDEGALDAAAAELQRIRAAAGIGGKLDEAGVGKALTTQESVLVTRLLGRRHNVTRIPVNERARGVPNPDMFLDGQRADMLSYAGKSWASLKTSIGEKLRYEQAPLIVVHAVQLEQHLAELAVREALAESAQPKLKVLVLGRTYAFEQVKGGG